MSSARLTRRDGFRPKLIALSVAACFSLSATLTSANPTGGAVASGSASFAALGNTLTVTNTANAIINWQSFSIGVNEITRFLQSSASSAVLNRVVGANGVIPQSVIDGILSSNGRVFLLNSSGIAIGASARIDVAGFVASSLNLSDADFLAGRLRFTETPGAGKVSNAGLIDTTSAGPGGRVFLVGPDVQNSGVIRTPQGEIILAAGKSVELVSENSPFVTVSITADSEQALNVGQLLADSGRIGIFAALVRQSGVAQANSAVIGSNGEIRLVATQNVTLDAGSITSASGGAQGGNVEVSAPVVVQAGDIRVDGDAGGNIQIDANNFLQAGTLSASGSAGPGGTIAVTAPHVIQTASAAMAADGSGGNGGSISVDASGATDGLLFSSASYSATGDKGGNITLLGHDILLLGASADASGASGGGTILVGGDLHGANAAVANASTTGVNFSTTLKADATQNGDGGKIVVWSDNNTQFYGTASARGGAQSGNGGSMEISGRDNLTMGGFADAGAANGMAGSVLLDPKNIVIDSNAGAGTLGSFQLLDPNPVAGNGFGTNVVVLSNQNVVVTAPNDNFGNTGAGAVFLYNSGNGQLLSALTGSSVNDHVGSNGITVLPSTVNFVIDSSSWNNGTATAAGAVTFASGATGVNGAVSAANSLVGSTTNDQVGSGGVTPLSNGNYVVLSTAWNASATVPQVGAVTVGSGTNGIVGAVSATNSLVGSSPNDRVGSNGIQELNNGAFVVISPNWTNSANGTASVGAVTFVNSTTNVAGAVSAANSLVGSQANDQVGSGFVTVLSNGNYLVQSPNWANGAATGAGAVTLMNGTNGTTVTGGALGVAVSTANSLVGSSINDNVGNFGVEQLSNGNYVVLSPFWTNSGASRAGAVTFGKPTGLAVGPISSTNSLVGSTLNDEVGQFGIMELPVNGNFVVLSPNWNISSVATLAGAVTFGNGSTGAGMTGVVSSANSLVGGTAGDQVGSGGVVALSNGNYVVGSPNWDQPGALPIVDAGAATWGSGTIGVSGVPSALNSLVGSKSGDRVGFSVVALNNPLSNGNYVVASPLWGNGAATQAGAVTLGNGATGTIGTVSTANSLVGSATGDQVGLLIREVGNGNFVVASSNWSNGAASQAGAVTFVNGTTGLTGAVSSSNSLVGSTAGDQVGNSVAPLSNGNYVVLSPNWSNGAATGAGAVTFGSGTAGVAGPVSATNSLVGSTTNDHVGSGFVTELGNGNYVVISTGWNNGPATSAGAVTLVNGANGNIVAGGAPGGTVSAGNSLVGTNTNDQVGFGGVIPLFSSGNYVVSSRNWNGGMGAVTFASGTAGIAGAVSSGNSLVGSTADNPNLSITGDHIGSGGVFDFTGGNYLVASPQWNNGTASRAGAVTWVSDTNGNVFGQASPGAVVSASNSLVGGTTNDQVGTLSCECNSGIHFLPNGNIVLVTGTWTNPTTLNANAGAVTFAPAAGIAGLITSANSILGTGANDSLGSGGIFPLINGNFVVSSPSASGGAGLVHVVTPGTSGGGAPATGQTFSSNSSSDVTITPASITAITNAGTLLTLQANNDITVNPGSDIVTVPTGTGGALTLQAGRSIVLNSSITTGNGNLTLTANETAPNGVIAADRDPGAAVITQAAGTTLNAGSGAITITLADGSGRTGTQATSGAITLGNVTTSGNLTVTNSGLTAGSDVLATGTLRGAALVKMTATGALGSATAPLQVAAASLSAGAANGIYITTNNASPAPVTVTNLINTTSGDIVLNAHGGATFPTLVSNPGGNVTINTFSPLNVQAGIAAGNSIFLSTSGGPTGSANDMSLGGAPTAYTYNTTSGVFEVTVGLGGQLTLPTGTTPIVLSAALFPNPVNITRFTFVQEPTEFPQLDTNAVIQGTNQLILANNAPSADELQKRNEENKKKTGAAACK